MLDKVAHLWEEEVLQAVDYQVEACLVAFPAAASLAAFPTEASPLAAFLVEAYPSSPLAAYPEVACP